MKSTLYLEGNIEMQQCEECEKRAWFEIKRADRFYSPEDMNTPLLPHYACRRHVASVLVSMEYSEGEAMRVVRIYFPGC